MIVSEIGDPEKSANAPLLSRYVTQNWSMWLTNTKCQKNRGKDKEKVHNWDLLCRTNRKKVISNRILPKLWMGLGSISRLCNSKLEMWLKKKIGKNIEGKIRKKFTIGICYVKAIEKKLFPIECCLSPLHGFRQHPHQNEWARVRDCTPPHVATWILGNWSLSTTLASSGSDRQAYFRWLSIKKSKSIIEPLSGLVRLKGWVWKNPLGGSSGWRC